MQDHYCLSDDQFYDLKTDAVKMSDLFKCVHLFIQEDARKTLDLHPVSKISLMFYLDRFGDFNQTKKKNPEPHKKIARAIFMSLGQSDKREILNYLEYLSQEMETDEDD